MPTLQMEKAAVINVTKCSPLSRLSSHDPSELGSREEKNVRSLGRRDARRVPAALYGKGVGLWVERGVVY
jgi:hypothetical protein